MTKFAIFFPLSLHDIHIFSHNLITKFASFYSEFFFQNTRFSLQIFHKFCELPRFWHMKFAFSFQNLSANSCVFFPRFFDEIYFLFRQINETDFFYGSLVEIHHSFVQAIGKILDMTKFATNFRGHF